MVPKDAYVLIIRTCDNDIWMADVPLQIQAYLILLQFILLCFTDIAFFFNWRFVATLCPASLFRRFSNICSLHVSVSHFGCWCCSVAELCSTLCKPTDCSMPDFPVLHYLPEFAQTHVHWVNDAIQPSHPLSSPSPGAFNLSQHQGLLQWVSSSHQVARVLELLPMNIQDWFPLALTGLISLQSRGLSRVFSNTTVQKHQFFGAQLSLQSSSHIHTWLLEKP